MNNAGEKAIIIGYAGRLLEEKGIYYLSSAFEKICCKHPNAYLLILGDGPLLPLLKNTPAKNSKIFLAGRVEHDEAMAILGKCHIVVNPSHYPEGLPTIILEAGVAKCAVISTPMGGSSEIISTETGILVTPRSSEELFLALDRLISDEEHRKKIAENLHGLVTANYTWDIISRKLSNEILLLAKAQ